MRQQLRHFEQNLNLKSILQETSDNATLESRDEDRLFFLKRKKGITFLTLDLEFGWTFKND